MKSKSIHISLSQSETRIYMDRLEHYEGSKGGLRDSANFRCLVCMSFAANIERPKTVPTAVNHSRVRAVRSAQESDDRTLIDFNHSLHF